MWRACDGYWAMRDDIFRQIKESCVKRKLPSSDMHYALCSSLKDVNWMRWEKGSGDGYENVIDTARMSLRVTRQTWRVWRMCLVIPFTRLLACMCVVRAAKDAAKPPAKNSHFPTAYLPTVWSFNCSYLSPSYYAFLKWERSTRCTLFLIIYFT